MLAPDRGQCSHSPSWTPARLQGPQVPRRPREPRRRSVVVAGCWVGGCADCVDWWGVFWLVGLRTAAPPPYPPGVRVPRRFKEKFAMTLIVAVTAGVPCLVLLTLVGVRHLRSLPFTQTLAAARGGDQRGIALQTVIIMVVLLAIAGGVAAVLFSRGQTATQQLEAQNISAAPATNYTSKTLCNSVSGLEWDDSSSTPGKQCRYTNQAACEAAGGVLASAGNAGQQPTVDAGDCVATDTSTGRYLGEIK